MAAKVRVVGVIGNGAAGVVAAAAARATGVQVVMVGEQAGATALGSGAVDIAAWPHLGRRVKVSQLCEHPVRACVTEVAKHNAQHPYAKLSDPAAFVSDGFELLQQLTGDLFAPLDLAHPNHPYLTAMGTVHAAATAQRTQHGIDPRKLGAAPVLLCIEGAGVAGAIVAEAIELLFQARPRVVEVKLAGTQATPMQVAFALERPEPRAALLQAVREQCRGATAVLAPPCLGIETSVELVAALADAAQAPVVELLGLHGSVPGYRLFDALQRGAAAIGVDRKPGRAKRVEHQGGRVVAVIVEHGKGEERVEVAAAVLATGKFIAGGIRGFRGFSETLLGMPVINAAGQNVSDAFVGDLAGRDPAEASALFGMGLRVDGRLRPIDGLAVPLKNLFATGFLLGGHDPFVDGTALGATLATAARAGREAGFEARS